MGAGWCWGGFTPLEQPRVYSKYYLGLKYTQKTTTAENIKTQPRNKSKIEIDSPHHSRQLGHHHPGITSPHGLEQSTHPKNTVSPVNSRPQRMQEINIKSKQHQGGPLSERPSPTEEGDFSRREDELQSTMRHPTDF